MKRTRFTEVNMPNHRKINPTILQLHSISRFISSSESSDNGS